MQCERRGMFETNSSSTHSIVIADGEFKPDVLPVRDGACIVYPGEFGWEEETHHDAATKASYCLTYVKNYAPQHAAMLRAVLEAEVGVPVAFAQSGGGYWSYGYIDHQSDSVCEEAFADADTLRRFIFNRASVLQTDNDNH